MESALREHSRLGASGAHLWGNCAGSVQMREHFREDEGIEAMEGNAMHEVFAQALATSRNAAEFLGAKVNVEGRNITRSFKIDGEAARNIQCALDYCKMIAGTPGTSFIEQRVDLTHIHPDMYSHLDFGHFGIDGVLTIVDYKNGRLSVEADGNWQIILYALGAIRTFGHEAPIPVRWVRLVIVQPNDIEPGPRIKQAVVDVSAIMAMIPFFQHVAALTDHPTPPFNAGKHCRYCPAFGACKTSRDHLSYVGNLMSIDFATADPRALKAAFEHAKLIKQRLKNLEDVATKRLTAGEDIGGLKLVTTVKHRAWVHEEAVKAKILEQFGPEPLECPTPAALEKYGPAARAFAEQNAIVPPGDPVAALADDKRKPYTVRSAVDIFGAKQ